MSSIFITYQYGDYDSSLPDGECYTCEFAALLACAHMDALEYDRNYELVRNPHREDRTPYTHEQARAYAEESSQYSHYAVYKIENVVLDPLPAEQRRCMQAWYARRYEEKSDAS